jgi:putative aldouronate transport system substrate-binding protein
MSKKLKSNRFMALLLSLCMMLAVLSGCGSSTTTTASSADTETATTEETSTAAAADTEDQETAETSAEEVQADDGWTYEPLSYPLQEGGELTYYMIKDLGQASSLASWNDHPMLQVIAEKTGVTLTINAVSQTNGSELMNLMLSSGDYPDMIENLSYSTGFAAAMDDDIVLPLNDLLAEYAPDYYQLLVENPDYKKSIATDDGRIGIFASITEGSRGPSDGLMINQDWLDELNLDAPVTFDDMENVLLAFKDKYDLTDPLYMVGDGILDNDQISASFGVALKFNSITGEGGFYVDEDGQIQFGYTQEGFVEYVTLMHSWYEEGLLSSDFVSNTTDYMNDDLIGEIASQKTGIFSRGDGLIDMLRSISGSNLVALADPVVNEGDIIHMGNDESLPSTGAGVVVTTGAEDPELCAMFLNWWYTEDGFLAGTYGQEDVSFTFDENGDPQYTELMTNTDGTTLSSQKIDYCGPIQLLIDGTTPEASYSQVAQDAPLVWGSNKDGIYDIPDAVELTSDEGDEFNTAFSDISTLCRQYTVQFITGDKDLSEVAAFQEQLNSMGVDTCCALYQAAYDRYMAR